MKKRLNWPVVALVLAAVLTGFVWWHWATWQRRADIAAGFGARVVCGCRYVEGRPMGSCRTDLAGLPGMVLVHLSDDGDARRVDAAVPFLARRSSHMVDGYGCMMDSAPR